MLQKQLIFIIFGSRNFAVNCPVYLAGVGHSYSSSVVFVHACGLSFEPINMK